MITRVNRKEARDRRHKRVRRKVFGTNERPRLCVTISNNNIFLQIIDDEKGETLVSASTLQKEHKVEGKNIEAGKKMGAIIAKAAKTKKIDKVVYDRGGRLYHGVVKAIAESARENGLEL